MKKLGQGNEQYEIEKTDSKVGDTNGKVGVSRPADEKIKKMFFRKFKKFCKRKKKNREGFRAHFSTIFVCVKT